MIKRYSDKRITELWSLEKKFGMWQDVEFAVIEAREQLGMIPSGTCKKIADALRDNPINIAFIDEREKVLHHDLNAFLEERMRFLTPELAIHFHNRMTSYDTEEAPFAQTIRSSCDIVIEDTCKLLTVLKELALRYRFTPMNARTHGQEAEMQSFGKRCLTWHQDLLIALRGLKLTMDGLTFSKLSGAIGTNSGISPELEEVALDILGFKPWAGATQIMPRVLYAPIASALANIACVIDKIATDIRLGSRSGRPLWHEPFGKMQKGSSAMPHKKNNIHCENTEGMAQMARSYALGIARNIQTWEERAIAQSSVERVFWPDLFHVTLRAIKNATTVLSGLKVYPYTMMLEIVESRGTYASNEAKEVLTALGSAYDITRDDAYRIVQLACFNAFEAGSEAKVCNKNPILNLEFADAILKALPEMQRDQHQKASSIKEVIDQGELRVSEELSADAETVALWNRQLRKLFSTESHAKAWEEIFKPSHILANEAHLFKTVFGE
jgi:adenylosuccinate lyase